MTRAPSEPPPCAGRDALVVAWAATLAALLVVTWRLWTPLRDTPRVAPWELLGLAPPGVDLALLALLGWLLCRVIWSRSATTRGLVSAVGLLGALAALDQLRWQPWAWHAVLSGVALAGCPRRRAVLLLRGLAVSVYAYSAIAKFDHTFTHTLGANMVGVLLTPLRWAGAECSPAIIRWLALGLPLGELAVAALLVVAWRDRPAARGACAAVCLLHGAILVVLGPWGLGHSAGVLVWNVGFAWQVVLLFRHEPRTIEDHGARSKLAERSATALIALAIVSPIGTPFGLWDQWPGWALYAPGGARAELYLHREALPRLPASLREHVVAAPNDPDGPWRRARLDLWVLAQTGAPIYPEPRVRAALTAALAERYPLGDRLRLVVQSRANRLTGERASRTLTERADWLRQSRPGGVTQAVLWTR